MIDNSEKLQKSLGTVGFWFSILVGVVNAISNSVFLSRSFQDAVIAPGVIEMFPIAIVLGITGWYRRSWTKVFQIAVLLACAVPTILSNYQGFPGIWFLTMSLVLMHKYGFLNKHVYVKVGAIGVWGFGWLSVSVANTPTTDVPFSWVLKIFLFVGMVLFFLYFTFEAELIKLNKERVVMEKEMERKRTLAKIGETTSGVVHSLKNNLNLFNVGLFYIESGTNVEKGVETIKRGVKTMHDRLQSLLEMTRINERGEPELINLERFVYGTFNLLYADSYSRNAIAYLSDPNKSIPIVVAKVPFVMVLENIFQNALEEFQKQTEPKSDKFVEFEAIQSGFILRNNAGHFPLCDDCSNSSCLNCPRFSKIGWTTKKDGSGNGISYIVRTCREFKWDFQIQNLGSDVVEFIFRWKTPQL